MRQHMNIVFLSLVIASASLNLCMGIRAMSRNPFNRHEKVQTINIAREITGWEHNCNWYDPTPIELAAENGDLQTILEFHNAGNDLNQRYGDEQIFSLLYRAIVNDKWHVARYLLAEDADATGLYFVETLLHIAVRRKCPLDICERLIEKGVDVNQPCVVGKTALHVAAEEGNLEAARFLLEHGADVDAAKNGGESPLHRAAWGAHANVIRLLLANGADPRKKNDLGRTPRDVTWNTGVKTLLENAEQEALVADLMADETRPQDIAELIASFVGAKQAEM